MYKPHSLNKFGSRGRNIWHLATVAKYLHIERQNLVRIMLLCMKVLLPLNAPFFRCFNSLFHSFETFIWNVIIGVIMKGIPASARCFSAKMRHRKTPTLIDVMTYSAKARNNAQTRQKKSDSTQNLRSIRVGFRLLSVRICKWECFIIWNNAQNFVAQSFN